MLLGVEDVAQHAKLLLEEAGVGHKLPTPVDDLVSCAELVVFSDITLDESHADYFAAFEEYAKALSATSYSALKAGLRKTWGMVDLHDNTIYIDRSVSAHKQAFLKLHEVGHKRLPWQRHTYLYLDDEKTLRPDVKRLYERQANLFAPTCSSKLIASLRTLAIFRLNSLLRSTSPSGTVLRCTRPYGATSR